MGKHRALRASMFTIADGYPYDTASNESGNGRIGVASRCRPRRDRRTCLGEAVREALPVVGARRSS
jgi:hypothetical protein